MRSEKAIIKEIQKVFNLTTKGQSQQYFAFLQGAYVALLWAAGLNGRLKKSMKFPSPTNKWRKDGFDG